MRSATSAAWTHHSLNCSTDIIWPTFDSFGTSLWSQTPIIHIKFPNNAVTPHDLNLGPLAYPQRVLSTKYLAVETLTFNYYVLSFDLQRLLSVAVRIHELIIYRQPSLRCGAAHVVHCAKGQRSEQKWRWTICCSLHETRGCKCGTADITWSRGCSPAQCHACPSRNLIFYFFFNWQTALNLWDNWRSCCLPLGAGVLRVTALRNGTSTSPQLHRGTGADSSNGQCDIATRWKSGNLFPVLNSC